MGKFWQTEPLLLSALGSGALWLAIFSLLSAFGHPLTGQQQTALLGLVAVIGTLIGRSQVTPTSGATAPTVNLGKVGKP